MNTLHHCTRNRLPSFSAAANARDCLMPRRATPSCQGRHLVEERPRQQASRLATTADLQCAGPAPGLITGRAAHAVSRTESNGTAATPDARGGASSPRSVAKCPGRSECKVRRARVPLLIQSMLRGYVCDRIRLSPADFALSARHKTLPSVSLATRAPVPQTSQITSKLVKSLIKISRQRLKIDDSQ
jgi:hypothetical protein